MMRKEPNRLMIMRGKKWILMFEVSANDLKEMLKIMTLVIDLDIMAQGVSKSLRRTLTRKAIQVDARVVPIWSMDDPKQRRLTTRSAGTASTRSTGRRTIRNGPGLLRIYNEPSRHHRVLSQTMEEGFDSMMMMTFDQATTRSLPQTLKD